MLKFPAKILISISFSAYISKTIIVENYIEVFSKNIPHLDILKDFKKWRFWSYKVGQENENCDSYHLCSYAFPVNFLATRRNQHNTEAQKLFRPEIIPKTAHYWSFA